VIVRTTCTLSFSRYTCADRWNAGAFRTDRGIFCEWQGEDRPEPIGGAQEDGTTLFPTPEIPEGEHRISVRVTRLKRAAAAGSAVIAGRLQVFANRAIASLLVGRSRVNTLCLQSGDAVRHEVIELDNVPAAAESEETLAVTGILNQCELSSIEVR